MNIILRFLSRKAYSFTFIDVLCAAILHILLSYAGFYAVGEEKLTESIIGFLYYYVVTASTIGYGDMSPSTEAGRLFAVLFFIPIAVGLFAAFITKAVSNLSKELTKLHEGFGDFSHLSGHTVIIGYTKDKTVELIRELHSTKEIVLLDDSARHEDYKGNFIRAKSLSAISDLHRSGISNSDKIIVMGDTDNQTLLAAMAAASVAKDKHIVAFFNDSSIGELLRAHCSNVEVVTDNSIAQIARSSDDPMISEVITNLVSIDDPLCLRSFITDSPTCIYQLHTIPGIKTIVAYYDGSSVCFDLSDQSVMLRSGIKVFYIGDKEVYSH